MSNESDDAITDPPFVPIMPAGIDEVMWIAYAAEIGDGVPSASGGTSSRPSSSMYSAPP